MATSKDSSTITLPLLLVEDMLRSVVSMRDSASKLREQSEMILCVAAGGEAHASDLPESSHPYNALMIFKAIKALGEDATDLICIEDGLAQLRAEIETLVSRAKASRSN